MDKKMEKDMGTHCVYSKFPGTRVKHAISTGSPDYSPIKPEPYILNFKPETGTSKTAVSTWNHRPGQQQQ